MRLKMCSHFHQSNSSVNITGALISGLNLHLELNFRREPASARHLEAEIYHLRWTPIQDSQFGLERTYVLEMIG